MELKYKILLSGGQRFGVKRKVGPLSPGLRTTTATTNATVLAVSGRRQAHRALPSSFFESDHRWKPWSNIAATPLGEARGDGDANDVREIIRIKKKLSRNARRVFQQVLEAFSRFKVDKKLLCACAALVVTPLSLAQGGLLCLAKRSV